MCICTSETIFTSTDIDAEIKVIGAFYSASFTHDTADPHFIYVLTGFESVPQVMDDIPTDLQMLSLGILDLCLDSEKQYKGSFWLECFRVMSYNMYHESYETSIIKIFYGFLHMLVKFNTSEIGILPNIWRSTQCMRKAAAFYSNRTDILDILSFKISRTSFARNYIESGLNTPDEAREDTIAMTEEYLRSLSL